MNYRLKISTLLFLLIPFFGISQEMLTGTVQNPAIVKAAKKWMPQQRSGEAVKLPFVDDFSNYSGYPDPHLWADRQGFVNTGFAVLPPTIGVITLDALNEYGQVYPQASRNTFPADTLTSIPIRLDSNFLQNRVMLAEDSIYFSF